MILENNSFDNKTIEKLNFCACGLIDPLHVREIYFTNSTMFNSLFHRLPKSLIT
jgi:hypothetical protein